MKNTCGFNEGSTISVAVGFQRPGVQGGPVPGPAGTAKGKCKGDAKVQAPREEPRITIQDLVTASWSSGGWTAYEWGLWKARAR